MAEPIDITPYTYGLALVFTAGMAVVGIGIAGVLAMVSLHILAGVSAPVAAAFARIAVGIMAGSCAAAIFAAMLHIIATGKLPELN